jgi:2-aminoethylphosphonate-pyruvate transaminase
MNDEPKKRLFTPGPLNTSATVKRAMLRDVGSRDEDFIRIVGEIRQRLLELAGVSQAAGFEAIPMQGSGTFGVEAVISTALEPDDRLLVLVNGAYGRRIHQIAQRWQIPCGVVESAENEPPDLAQAERMLASQPGYTHLAAVHCETTSGILNPLEEMGALAKRHGCRFIVDAMSSFGAIPVPVRNAHIDFMISSSNKCLEGVPGFSFIIANRQTLQSRPTAPRTLSLDLIEQWEGLEANGQFRFTPPTHAMLAFHQALAELEQEGGVSARAERYRKNHQTLLQGMGGLGFREYVPRQWQSPIITTFLHPADERFEFQEFYRRLAARNLVIYPGKLTQVDSFRIGTIGQIYPADVEALLSVMRSSLQEMKVALPLP